MGRDRLAAYWCSEFEGKHGIPYPFEKADGVILHGLLKTHGRYALAWMIQEFHGTHDDFVAVHGWSVRAFKLRALGLALRYREMRAETEKHAARAAMEAVPGRVLSLVDRFGW